MSLDPHDEAFADRWDEVGQKNNATTSYKIARRVHQDRTHLRMTLDTTRGSTEILGDGEFDTSSGFIELACQKHAPRDLFIGVYPWSYSSIVAKMFGAQDIVIGEPEFDRAFVIKSNREEWIKLFLIRELKEKLSALTSSSIFFRDEKAVLRCEFDLHEDLPQKIKNAIDVLLLFGTQGKTLLRIWDGFAQSFGGSLSGDTEIDYLSPGSKFSFELRGALLSVELMEIKSGLLSKSYTLCTKISCEKTRPLSFTLSKTSRSTQDPGQTKLSALYQISTNDEQRLQELLSSHHEDLLLLQPSTFVSDSHGVSLVLPGVILNIDPLERAAHLIAEVCFDEDAPYR